MKLHSILIVAFLLSGCGSELPRSSDWIASLPEGETKRKLILGCTPCHQVGIPSAIKSTAQQWESVIGRMKKIDDDLDLSLIPFHDGELARWLAEHGKEVKRGKSIKTVPAKIREYSAGPWEGFYHDMALAYGRAWIADYFGNTLYEVDPETGNVESYPIPVAVPKGKPGGAHQIDITRDGSLWITFTKAEQVARFDMKEKKFRIYSGFKKGGNVQYFVLDANRFIYEDEEGRIWMTHFSREILSRLDPKTGKIETFATPRTEHLPEKGVHLYAAVADSKGRIWYTETHGNRFGMLNPKTKEAKEWEMSEKWSGPKRLAIDERDRLWIPELATGKITVYDTKTAKIIERISLPIKGDYPYAIRRNPHTGDLWVTGSGSDSLYKLNPETKKFVIYRLPRRGAYTRTIAFDEKGNIWTCYASYPNAYTEMPHKSGVIVRITPEK